MKAGRRLLREFGDLPIERPVFNPAALPFTLRLQDSFSTSGGNVTQWSDVSGNARHFVAPGTLEPSVGALQGGKNTAQFIAASADRLNNGGTLADFISDVEYTIFGVLRADAFGNEVPFPGGSGIDKDATFFTDNSGFWGLIANNGTVGICHYSPTVSANASFTAAAGEWLVFSARFRNGDGIRARKNLDPGTVTPAGLVSSLVANTTIGRGYAGNQLEGRMGALWISKSRFEDAAISDAIGFLISEYGIGATGTVYQRALVDASVSTTTFTGLRSRAANVIDAAASTTSFSGIRSRVATLPDSSVSTSTFTASRSRQAALSDASATVTTLSGTKAKVASCTDSSVSATTFSTLRSRAAAFSDSSVSTTTFAGIRSRLGILADSSVSTTNFVGQKLRVSSLLDSSVSSSTFGSLRTRRGLLSDASVSNSTFQFAGGKTGTFGDTSVSSFTATATRRRASLLADASASITTFSVQRARVAGLADASSAVFTATWRRGRTALVSDLAVASFSGLTERTRRGLWADAGISGSTFLGVVVTPFVQAIYSDLGASQTNIGPLVVTLRAQPAATTARTNQTRATLGGRVQVKKYDRR